jgi:hypothetical protein
MSEINQYENCESFGLNFIRTELIMIHVSVMLCIFIIIINRVNIKMAPCPEKVRKVTLELKAGATILLDLPLIIRVASDSLCKKI